MIQAYLNNNELRLFPDTAIGLSIENFNISDLSNRKIDRTNVIQIPKAGNETVFQFSDAPNAPTDFAYNSYSFDLIVDGFIIYENGYAYIIGEDDRSYTLNITNNKNIIDLLKSIKLADLYTGDTITVTNTTDWRDLFTEKTNGFKIDIMFRGGDPTANAFSYVSALSTVSIYISTILAKIAADYSITFSGDLLTDADYVQMRIPMVQSNIKRTPPNVNYILQDIIIHNSLTAWDLIKNVLQLTCGVFKINGIDLELQKFNDLDYTTPVDWSGKLVSKSKKFSVPGIAQKNYIRYSVAENVDPLAYAATIDCNNTNIDYEKDIASMKAKLFPLRDVFSFYANASAEPLFAIQLPDLKAVPATPSNVVPLGISAVADMQIIVDSAEYVGQPLAATMAYLSFVGAAWTYDLESGNITVDADTTIVKYYDPSANYSLIETMLTDPVFYEAELNLNILDVYQFDYFKAVKIDELEGVFYVNKIIDFLATSPGVPTRVELIKIS